MSTSNSTRPRARPVYPPLQPSSRSPEASSAYQSYSSTSSLASPSPASSAPLPSPSATHSQQRDFFGSLGAQQQHAQQQQAQQAQQRHPMFDYRPNREGAGTTAAETANYLNQAALLAEAAKRAQMAVVMRDIEGMEL